MSSDLQASIATLSKVVGDIENHFLVREKERAHEVKSTLEYVFFYVHHICLIRSFNLRFGENVTGPSTITNTKPTPNACFVIESTLAASWRRAFAIGSKQWQIRC